MEILWELFEKFSGNSSENFLSKFQDEFLEKKNKIKNELHGDFLGDSRKIQNGNSDFKHISEGIHTEIFGQVYRKILKFIRRLVSIKSEKFQGTF